MATGSRWQHIPPGRRCAFQRVEPDADSPHRWSAFHLCSRRSISRLRGVRRMVRIAAARLAFTSSCAVWPRVKLATLHHGAKGIETADGYGGGLVFRLWFMGCQSSSRLHARIGRRRPWHRQTAAVPTLGHSARAGLPSPLIFDGGATGTWATPTCLPPTPRGSQSGRARRRRHGRLLWHLGRQRRRVRLVCIDG